MFILIMVVVAEYYDNLLCIAKSLQGDKSKDYDKECSIHASTKKEMCE